MIYERLAVRRIHEGQVTHQWLEEYPEGMEVLCAGGAPPGILAAEKRKLVNGIATCLIKNLQPAKAREFMLKELGDEAKKDRLYAATMLPPPVLAMAKEARRMWLSLRHHPMLATTEERAVHDLITPRLCSVCARKR